MIKIGILGAAGYTGGELIRLLINHPEAEIIFANSESNAGNLVADVHEGLLGDTDLRFTDTMPFDEVDVVFFCFGHGKSEQFLQEHTIPEHVKIIDLAQDFRIAAPTHDYVYGLPEMHKEQISQCQHLANPGCFATCIQLGLLPLAKAGLLTHDVAVNAITGSTGAGKKPGETTHFSYRSDNISIYKLSVFIYCKASVCITVVCKSHIQIIFYYEFLQGFNMCRTTICIDICSIWSVVYYMCFSTKSIKYTLSYLP